MRNVLSKTSKLDGNRSWSLQARETCPGSVKKDGSLVEACSGCYATIGNYYLPDVIAVRADNKLAWQQDNWVELMVKELDNDRYFRWFDSGDCYHISLAHKMLEIMIRTPWCRHWFPTRMYKFEKFVAVFELMQALPNVNVRYSSDSIDGSYGPEHGSTIVWDESQVDSETHLCRSFEHAGKCNGCRVCWDKSVPVVAYKTHGNRMKGVVKRKKVIDIAVAA